MIQELLSKLFALLPARQHAFMARSKERMAARSATLVLKVGAWPVLILALGLCAGPAAAKDWPRWRGGLDGNGVSDATGLPDTFDQTSGKTGDPTKLQNVKWVVRLGGCTYGSPVVADGKVYIGGAMDFRGCAVLWCFRESDGKMLWRLRSPHWPKLINRTCGVCCAPTVDGNRVYVLGHQGEVFCLDANGLAGRPPSELDLALLTAGRECTRADIAPDGRRIIELSPGTPGVAEPTDGHIIWQYDLLREVNCWPHDAQTAGVLIRGDCAFVATGSVALLITGGTQGSMALINKWKAQYGKSKYESPALIVLDKSTGKLLATDQEGIFERTFNGAHSSPVVGTVNGKELVFYAGGDGVCYAFDPDFAPGEGGKAGALKLVWKYDCVAAGTSRAAKFKRAEAMGTPVFYNNRIYLAVGNDLDTRNPEPGTGRLVCIDATKTGDVTTTATVWSFDQITNTSSTVAIANGLLFTADAGGNIYCIDADTGALCWTHKGASVVWSSPVIADGKVYVAARSDLLVFAVAREEKLLGRTKLRDLASASPAVANGVLYLATDKFLYALQSGQSATLDPTLSPWTEPKSDGVTRPVTTTKPATKAVKPRPTTRRATTRPTTAQKIARRWKELAGTGGVVVVVVVTWALIRRRRTPSARTQTGHD